MVAKEGRKAAFCRGGCTPTDEQLELAQPHRAFGPVAPNLPAARRIQPKEMEIIGLPMHGRVQKILAKSLKRPSDPMTQMKHRGVVISGDSDGRARKALDPFSRLLKFHASPPLREIPAEDNQVRFIFRNSILKGSQSVLVFGAKMNIRCVKNSRRHADNLMTDAALGRTRSEHWLGKSIGSPSKVARMECPSKSLTVSVGD